MSAEKRSGIAEKYILPCSVSTQSSRSALRIPLPATPVPLRFIPQLVPPSVTSRVPPPPQLCHLLPFASTTDFIQDAGLLHLRGSIPLHLSCPLFHYRESLILSAGSCCARGNGEAKRNDKTGIRLPYNFSTCWQISQWASL